MKHNLNGTWELICEDKKLTNVEIPGSVLSGLYNAGLIEDPFYRTNEYIARRELYKDYTFAKTFDIELNEGSEYILVFEGVDTDSDIYLNNQKILSTNNMFRKYETEDIKDILKPEGNELTVKIRSPFSGISSHENAPGKEINYVSTGVLPGAQYMRKAGSSFGWDWGPELPDMGIHKNVYIEEVSSGRILDIETRQTHSDGKVNLFVGAYLDVIADDLILSFTLTSPDGESFSIDEAIGDEDRYSMRSVSFDVNDPILWWPRGYGEQPLYNLTIELKKSDEVLDTKELKVGLRTITVNRDKIDDGENFAVTVNGVSVFLMGANYIPEDVIYSRITIDTYKRLIDAATFANYNCLRVWGGGYYPDEEFLSLLDENGILLWQDLMFACLVYEVDDAFLENVKTEVDENIRRISNHACLALVAGNNEMEYAWSEWDGYRDHSEALRQDYLRLFEEEFPKIIGDISPDIFYWPSSPSKGGGFKDSQKENAGDTHYWVVWHGEVPFSEYENHKFRMCSEFGFQSFPDIKTVRTYAEDDDMNIFSPVMECHQKNPSANGKIMKYLADTFKNPKDFESLLYISQLMQALALKTGVDHFRRNRGDCMGALYWQINDNWPVASWSSVDYYGRYKAAHYYAKRFYNPISPTIVIKREGYDIDSPITSFEQMSAEAAFAKEGKVPVTYEVVPYIANETMDSVSGSYEISVIDMNFNTLYSSKGEINASGLSYCSGDGFTLPDDAYDHRRYVIVVGKFVIGGATYYDVKPLAPYKELYLESADVKVSTTIDNDELVITLSSDKVSLFTEIICDDYDLIFSDNYIDLVSSEDRIITAKLPEEMLDNNIIPSIRVRSLKDTY
ncbi:MAG: glycoside hydrolase family 2 protein [Lachnospiraceae bacterium]|nr:glycoside hydrolase family 2 protein [Lachnospiraceae bacterium]